MSPKTANSVAIARLRRAILMAGADGLTVSEMEAITSYANPAHAPANAVSGSGMKLERVSVRRAGEIIETQVFRVANGADALTLILHANRMAAAWGYEGITNDDAMDILKLYPSDAELSNTQ